MTGNHPMYKSCALARVLSASLLFLAVTVLGCNESSGPERADRILIDDLEREVRIPTDNPRVVSLAPSVTEVLFAAGASEQIIAVTTADDYPPDVLNLAKVTAFPLDHEAVVAYGPDLILATDQINSVKDMDSFATLGIPSFFLTFNTVSDIFSAIRTMGVVMGTSQVADRVADSLATDWKNRRAAVSASSRKPKILLLAGNDVLYSFGRESYTMEMIEAAGGQSVTAVLEGQSAVLSDEFVLSAQPDMIIGTFGDDFDVRQILERHPTWSVLPATQSGRIYSISPDLVSRPGPRVLAGTQQIADWITQPAGAAVD